MHYLSESVLNELEQLHRKQQIPARVLKESTTICKQIGDALFHVGESGGGKIRAEELELALKLSARLQAFIASSMHDGYMDRSTELMESVIRLRQKLRDFQRYRQWSVFVRSLL